MKTELTHNLTIELTGSEVDQFKDIISQLVFESEGKKDYTSNKSKLIRSIHYQINATSSKIHKLSSDIGLVNHS